MKNTGVSLSSVGPAKLLIDVVTEGYSDRFFVGERGYLLTAYNLTGDDKICVLMINGEDECDGLISARQKWCCGCDFCLTADQPQLAITIPGQYQLEICGTCDAVKVYGKAIGTGVMVDGINRCCAPCT